MIAIVSFLLILLMSKTFQTPVHQMTPTNQLANISGATEASLTVFCWQGKDPTIRTFWSSVSFHLHIESVEYKVHYGPNESSVAALAMPREKYWHTEVPWRSKKLRFNPFQDCCVGIFTSETFQLQLEYLIVNLLLVIFSLASLTMFLLAPFLSRNTMVHYTAWVTMGIFFSLVFLTFLLQKRFRQSLFSWIFLAYSASLYLMTNSWYYLNNMLSISTLPWLLGYCLVTGLVSWAALYRLGPPSHPRTLSLIQWTLQGLSLILMGMSSYNTLASISITSIILLWSVAPPGLLGFLSRVRKKFIKPKRHLLSHRQLQEQSDRETRLALEHLRRHCQNNETQAWGLVTRLRSPARFAEFVEGGSHVTEEEVDEHRRWASEDETTDTDCDISCDTIDMKDTTDDENNPVELGHRFSCFLCNEKLLGHRFSCAQCLLEC